MFGGHGHHGHSHGSHGHSHGHSHSGMPPNFPAFEFLRSMMMAHQISDDDDDDDDGYGGYYDSEEDYDSDDYYDDDDDEYYDDSEDEDDLLYHGHSHGGVPCHGHSHGGGPARKPKSEHYLSMSEVLKDLKKAIEQKDQFKAQAMSTTTTTATKVGKGKKKKKVSTEQSVKQDYTDALFQIGENMEDMQRFTDELPEFIEAGGVDLLVVEVQKEGLNPNEIVLSTSNHLGNAAFAVLSNMIDMTDADEPDEDPEDYEPFSHNVIIEQLENTDREPVLIRLWYIFSSEIEKLPYVNTANARQMLQEVLEFQMKTVCGIEKWRKNLRQWWGGLEVENFLNCGRQILKDLSDVKNGVGLSKDAEKNLKFKDYAYFCSETWLKTASALIRTTLKSSNLVSFFLSVPDYHLFLKNKLCTCEFCSFLTKEYKREDWESDIAFNFLQNGGFEIILQALDLSIEDSIDDSTLHTSMNLILLLVSEPRSSESLDNDPVPKGTATKLLRYIRHFWTAHVSNLEEGSGLQDTYYNDSSKIFDLLQTLCTMKPGHSAELITEEAIGEWSCLLRCIIERIKLNIIPKNSHTHCHEHPREWRVLVPLLALLVRDNYSFGEYLWDEELEVVEILLTKLTPSMIQSNPLWACSVFRILYYGVLDESYAENVASRVKKSSSVGLVAEVKRSAAKCANLNFWAQKLYGAIQALSPTNRKPQKIKAPIPEVAPLKLLPAYFSPDHPVVTPKEKSIQDQKKHMEELRDLQNRKQEFYKRQRQRKQEQAKEEEQRKIEKRQLKNKLRREQEAKDEEEQIKILLQKKAELEREKQQRQAQARLEEQLLSNIIALQKKHPDARAKKLSQELNAKGLNVTEAQVNAIMEKYELLPPTKTAQQGPAKAKGGAGGKKKNNKKKNKKR